MSRFKYKEISFASGWDGTLAEFKKEFSNVHTFKKIKDEDERNSEMKRVHALLIKSSNSKEKKLKKEPKKPNIKKSDLDDEKTDDPDTIG